MFDRKAYLSWRAALVLLVGGVLGGCAKSDLLIDEQPTAVLISTSLRSYAGANAVLDEGVQIGIVSDTPDAYVEFNLPYTLKGGALVPSETALSLPEDTPSVHLSAYAPYTSDPTYWQLIYARGVLTQVNFLFGVHTDQRTEGTASSDLLWATATYSGPTTKTHLAFEHRFAKIKIRLTSELGNNLSDAQVTLLEVCTGGRLKFSDGAFELSRYASEAVTAFALPDGSYEAIVPPQSRLPHQAFIQVATAEGKSYTFRTSDTQLLAAGKEYLFTVQVKDKGDLPFTVALTCDNQPLGDRLSIGHRAVSYPIGMTEIPSSGGGISYTKLRIRNAATGEPCWASITNSKSLVPPFDVVYHGVDWAVIGFDENLSPEPRTMVLEFYNTIDPKFVHKRVLVEQAGATDYFTLSAPGLTIDRWGNLYDRPTTLTVHASQGWTLDNSVPDWVTVAGYTPGNRNQTLQITVQPNATANQRAGELRFMVGGTVAATYRIEQKTTADPSFTLHYDLDLCYTTTDNKFKASNPQTGEYCVSTLIIFAKYEPLSDAAAEVWSNALYGYVVDAPASFNRAEIKNMSSDYFIFPNYTGRASVLSGVNSTLLGPRDRGRLTFYRQLIFDLPIPPNVPRDHKVHYVVTINNVQNTAVHDSPTVTYTIIKQ